MSMSTMSAGAAFSSAFVLILPFSARSAPTSIIGRPICCARRTSIFNSDLNGFRRCARPERLQELADEFDAARPRHLRPEVARLHLRSFCVVLFGPKTFEQIRCLDGGAHAAGCSPWRRPIAVATAPVRATALHQAGLGAIRARNCGDRNLDRHSLERHRFSPTKLPTTGMTCQISRATPTGMRLNPPTPR